MGKALLPQKLSFSRMLTIPIVEILAFLEKIFKKRGKDHKILEKTMNNEEKQHF